MLTFRPPSRMRRLYWAVTLAAMGAILWYLRGILLPFYEQQP